VLHATVRAAVTAAGLIANGLPIFAGGKSMGGRMTSQAQAVRPLAGVGGLVFVGFPLHPVGEPGTSRADHLMQIAEPMLFLQGTRDRLALPDLLNPVLARLGDRARVEWLQDGDHDFKVPVRGGMTRAQTLDWIALRTRAWMREKTI
jgi:predicted alpha/beta-hydrolase family hydrolase